MQIKSSLLREVDRLCLQAAFGSNDLAQNAWRELCENWTFDDLQSDLIPIVFANVEVDDSNKFAGLMRGYHRYQWCKNQIVMQDINTILHQFQRQSIPVILGGMVSVLHHFYEDCGMRSIGHTDFITQPGDLQRAQNILHQLRPRLKSQAELQITTNLASGIGPRRSKACWRNAANCDIFGNEVSCLGREDTFIYILSACSSLSASTRITCFTDILKALKSPFSTTTCNQKITQYRIAAATKISMQHLSQILLEAALFDQYQSVIPPTRIGFIESTVNRHPSAERLLAASSKLIGTLTRD